MDLLTEAVRVIERLRRALGRVLPEAWMRSSRPAGGGPQPRQPSPARIELRPDAPAESWVAWEVSRSGDGSRCATEAARGEISEQ